MFNVLLYGLFALKTVARAVKGARPAPASTTAFFGAQRFEWRKFGLRRLFVLYARMHDAPRVISAHFANILTRAYFTIASRVQICGINRCASLLDEDFSIRVTLASYSFAL